MQSIDYLSIYKLRAKKSLGQNFLVDETILKKISESIDISWNNIIEVGPWYGALTFYLLEKHPQALHLVELDFDMIEILGERFNISTQHLTPTLSSQESQQTTDIQIFHQDILTFTPDFQEYSVVANIPYYITSPILTHFLYTLKFPAKNMLILMQRDVGDKILWWKKSRSSVLALMIAKKCFVTEKLLVPAKSFIPVPKVESSILYFETHEKYSSIDDEGFLKFIKIWFAEPRKKLIKNLIKWGYSFQKILDFFCQQWISENIRWEAWDIEFWTQLYTFLK